MIKVHVTSLVLLVDKRFQVCLFVSAQGLLSFGRLPITGLGESVPFFLSVSGSCHQVMRKM